MSQISCTLVVGISSGIGEALSNHLIREGYTIVGTSRDHNFSLKGDCSIYPLDLSSRLSIDRFVSAFSERYCWSQIIFCPAAMSPIGSFESIDICNWLNTFDLNFSNQVYLLHGLLPHRASHSRVLFFAGGGTNSAPKLFILYRFKNRSH